MAEELNLRMKGTQIPIYLGTFGQAVMLEAGLILLFFFLSFSFPSDCRCSLLNCICLAVFHGHFSSDL